MGRQSRLVLLLFVAVSVCQLALASTPSPSNIVTDNIKDNELDVSEELLPDLPLRRSDIKLSEPKENAVKSSPSAKKVEKSTVATSTTHKPVSDEILSDLIEASKHSTALADDPRFNNMLPDNYKAENETVEVVEAVKTVNIDKIDYSNVKMGEVIPRNNNNYFEDDDYLYNFHIAHKWNQQSTTAKPITEEKKEEVVQKIEMKPIKEDVKVKSKTIKVDTDKKNVVTDNDDNNQNNEEDDDYDDDDDDDDEYNEDNDNDDDNDDDTDDDDDNDIADEEEVVFSENVPCPRYCVCARNINSYLVATCSRLDGDTQKFGSDITDLIVTDVGPKYPIVLGPDFFVQMGLKYVSSIKIANCTVEFMHPLAFQGLEELYSVNLTNIGLAIINPDTFTKNKKLRMLTISGNDLSVMSTVSYLLKSTSIEELDLSRNNLVELNPNAFSELPNVVYINLSQNNLQKIPEKVFDHVEIIEELDLSYNSLKTLPPTIFNRTSLVILHLKYNVITGDLRFGTNDMQQLDLSFNSINEVHHGMFDKMTRLTNLNLKGNGITKIQADSFLALKDLRHIDLSINELDQISSMVFYKNSELDVIRLNDNPRLSQLPTDGFLNYNGYFTVYYLDISNCAIGALGDKTFSTMPHLVSLKLAWNNINNLERDTFASLYKLNDLDLSNNLIARLDELMFMRNNEMTKLNLAGNPIHKLSVRLFLPLTSLRELDVSDCELTSLLSDNQYGVGRKYKFYQTLRSFNASANQIKKISSADVKSFKNLRTLDISRNPLKCNEEFQDFIAYASVSSNLVPHRINMNENLEGEDASKMIEFQAHAGWAELAHEVCKHEENKLHKYKGDKLEKKIEKANKDLDEDVKNLLNIVETSKMNKLQKILKDSRKSEVVVDDHVSDSADEDVNEDDLNNGGEDKEEDGNNANEEKDEYDDEENESDYDDEDGSEEPVYETYEKEKSNEKKSSLPKIKNHGIKVEQIELSKETRDKFLQDKFSMNGYDNLDNSQEEEIIIERGHVYYSGYRFLVPLIILISCVLVLLLIIAKIISVIMRKRGERYRMALLQSSKNSIVYQKLSEDILPPPKESKQPKVHRYTPINQV